MHAPADWYPDPTDRHAQRWWDGRAWSEHVYSDGVQSVDPLDSAAPGLDDASLDEASPHEAETTSGEGDDVREAEAAVLAAHLDAVDFFTPRTPPPPLPYPSGAVRAAEPLDETETGGEAAPAPTDDDVPAAVAAAPDANSDDHDPDDREDEDEDDDLAPWTMRADAPEARQPTPSSSGLMGDVFVMPAATVHDLTSRRHGGVASAPAPAMASLDEAGEAEKAEEADLAAGSEPDAAPDASAPAPDEVDADAPSEESTDQAAAPHASVPHEVDGLGSGDPLGIRGPLLGDEEPMSDDRVRVDNRRLLRCALDDRSGAVARLGTIVATQGVVELGVVGATRWAHRKRAPSLPLVRATGTGDVFFADDSQHVTLLQLSGSGSGLVTRAEALLAFDNLLGWGVEHAGDPELAPDLVTVQVHGDGWIALLSDGEPIALPTEGRPTHVDLHALVAWSGALRMRVMRSGPTQDVQVAFEGHGVVIVQPSPGMLVD